MRQDEPFAWFWLASLGARNEECIRGSPIKLEALNPQGALIHGIHLARNGVGVVGEISNQLASFRVALYFNFIISDFKAKIGYQITKVDLICAAPD